ncbi:hypothetical protein [Glaciibacter superstes]|uniref:hypothetical protein n=1 Tax=Glaciibacter superstes TaxID=501023 RepID=UPI0003B63CE4|nr:hypothetical protein [Glaciibacter superstes]
MAEEAEALADILEDGSEWFTDDDGHERWGHKSDKPQTSKRSTRTGSQHHPTTDAEAQALITRLGHFDWDTHKVSGRYSRAPYTLVAVIDGMQHSIHLPGRFGTTLTWLMKRVEEMEEVK